MPQLQDLPEKVLTKILGYSKFKQLVPLRRTSRTFHKICTKLLNTAFINLEPRLKSQLETVQFQIKVIHSSKDLAKFLFHYRILQILEGEVRALNTVCGRYIARGVYCFTGGALLDCFYGITSLQSHQLKESVERSVAVQLYLLCEEFADHFEEVVEPKLSVPVALGAKIVDLLDTFLDSNYQLLATTKEDAVQLVGCYEVFSASEGISAPPKPSSSISSPAEVNRLVRYLRNTVRWHNLCHCLDTGNKKSRGKKPSNHRELCLDVPGSVQEDTGKGDHDVRRVYMRAGCKGETNGYKQGLACSLNLQCPSEEVPRRLHTKKKTSSLLEKGTKYEFSMEIRVRYCTVEEIEEVTKEAVIQFHHSKDGCLLVQNTHRVESYGSESSLG